MTLPTELELAEIQARYDTAFDSEGRDRIRPCHDDSERDNCPSCRFYHGSRTDLPRLVEAVRETRQLLTTLVKLPIDDDSVCLQGDYRKGLHCGVEDHDLQGRGYDAADYGFERGVDRTIEYFRGQLSALIGRARRSTACVLAAKKRENSHAGKP